MSNAEKWFIGVVATVFLAIMVGTFVIFASVTHHHSPEPATVQSYTYKPGTVVTV